MKKLVLVLLFIPLLSSAQHFEFSEMAGYSAPALSSPSTSPLTLKHGFSNQLTANYYFIKYFSLGAFYELNSWDPVISSIGLTADAHYHHVYAGINISDFDFVPYTKTKNDNDYWGVTDRTTYKYQPSLAYGAHIGYAQKLTRHIAAKLQLGYDIATLKVQASSPEFNNIGPVSFPNGNYATPITYYYILAGIAYRL